MLFWVSLLAAPGIFLFLYKVLKKHRSVVLRRADRCTTVPIHGTTSESPETRVMSLNACVLTAGFTFSLDGKDMKDSRLDYIIDLSQDYDVIVLQEVWGCRWTRRHVKFYDRARAAGFNVIHTTCGLALDSGNVILSRRSVFGYSSHSFVSSAGWQHVLPNGVLHACVDGGRGAPLHVFTAHLQCDTTPFESILNSGSKAARAAQITEMHDFILRTVPAGERWLVIGDFNVLGKSDEYRGLADTFGRQSLMAPDFPPTFNCFSFLAPPNWRAGDRGVQEFTPLGCVDHAFTNCEVSSSRVITDKKDISDHFPLEVVLKGPTCA